VPRPKANSNPNGHKPFIECESEKVLRPHTFIGVARVSSSTGFRHIYSCDVCCQRRVWGATKSRPEGSLLLDPKGLPPSCLQQHAHVY
jgi:hypothetical protein